jgi:alpha-amylase
MTRRPEAYHHDLIESERRQKEGTGQTEGVKTIHDISRVKREDLGQYLHYDRYRRASLIDHFLLPHATIGDFINSTYDEIGDFVSSPYEPSVKESKNGLLVHLKRVGSIRSVENYVPFKVEKKLILNHSEEGMLVKYDLTNLADVPLKVLFGSEWNLSLTEAGHNDHCSYSKPNTQSKRHRLKQVQDVTDVENLHISDPSLELAMTLSVSQPARLWRFPIETVTNSDDGYELTFQGSCSVLIWSLELKPGEKWNCDLRWELVSSS